MEQSIKRSVENAILGAQFLKENYSVNFIKSASLLLTECFEKGNKLLIAGNGGSLCDAMHFAEEFTGFFRQKRKALPAICLSDPGHLSCVANDIGYEYVFQRAVEAYGKQGDVFIALTTSGNSDNLYNALETAGKNGLKTLSFLGKTGGRMKGLADLEWIVPNFSTSDRIQEVHMTAIHIIIEMVECALL